MLIIQVKKYIINFLNPRKSFYLNIFLILFTNSLEGEGAILLETQILYFLIKYN
jgi:hypothetical protein